MSTMKFLTDFADQAVVLPMVAAVSVVLAAQGWWRGALAWLCVVGMTEGQGPISRAVCAAWKGLHGLSPRFVGGCRPLRVRRFLDPDAWRVVHAEVVSAFGICSEVVIAASDSR